MAYDFTVARLYDLRAFPECLGQRIEAEGTVKPLTRLDHLHRVIALRGQQFGDVVAQIAGARGRDDIIDIPPFLRPHIAQQIGADRTGRWLNGITIFFVELGAGIAMKLVIERLDLGPDLVGQLSEVIGWHVIFGTPHGACIGKTQFLGPCIGDADEFDIIVAHGCTDIVMPADPHFLEFLGIAVDPHLLLYVAAVDRLALERPFTLAISRLKLCREFVQFLGCASRGGRRQRQRGLQQVEPPSGFG